MSGAPSRRLALLRLSVLAALATTGSAGCAAIPPPERASLTEGQQASTAPPLPRACPVEPVADDVAPEELARLAAVCAESAARGDGKRQRAQRKQALTLWQRLFVGYPDHEQAVAARNHFAYGLSLEGRELEATDVWRALVCANHFAMPTVVVELGAPPQNRTAAITVEYPATCAADPALAESNVEEIWWRIGNHEAQLHNEVEGASLVPAIAAYRHAQSHPGPLADVVHVSLALAVLEQGDEVAARSEFVLALDALARRGEGEPIAALRTSLARGFAQALLEEGRGNDEVSLWELEVRLQLEKLAGQAAARLAEETVLPSDRSWGILVYLAFAESAVLLGLPDLGTSVLQQAVVRWPQAAEVATVQLRLIESFDQQAMMKLDLKLADALKERRREAELGLLRLLVDAEWTSRFPSKEDELRSAIVKLTKQHLGWVRAVVENPIGRSVDQTMHGRMRDELEHGARVAGALLLGSPDESERASAQALREDVEALLSQLAALAPAGAKGVKP